MAQRTDSRLGRAAHDALAKIAAVLPAPLRHELEHSALLIGPGVAPPSAGDTESAAIRTAIRNERKLHLTYRDAAQRDSERTVWPFALGYFERVRVLVAWCELRRAARHFRCDRIVALQPLPERYPQRRQALLKAWRAAHGTDKPAAATTADGN